MAPPKSRPVFDEDDDSDSVKTDSTVESDFQAEYSVEKILAERQTAQGKPLYLVKWEGYELHRSTWEPPEHFLDDSVCLVNWALHKRAVDEGRAKPFKVAKFDAAVRLDAEQRERRHAKRAEKRRQKEAREPTPRRRLIPRKDLAKRGTARKATARDGTSSPSSVTEKSPRKRITPLFEPSSPSGSASRKRRRSLPDSRSPSPALSVNDVSNSQYSMFNERTTTPVESPHKSPSHSTTVPKRARVNDPSNPKENTEQRSGTAATLATSKPKLSTTSNVQKEPQPSGAASQVTASKAKPPEQNRNETISGSAKPQQSKLVKSSTVPNLSTGPGNITQRRASDATPAAVLTESRDNSKNKEAPSTATSKSHVAVTKDRQDPGHSTATNSVQRPVAGPSRKAAAPIKLFVEPKAKPRQRQRVNKYTPKNSTDPQFVNLSTKRRMQQYSHNEPPPDPNALKFVDPNTGRILGSTNGNTSSTSSTLRLDTSVARTSDLTSPAAARSAPASERRSVSTSKSQREPLRGISAPQSTQETEPRFAYPSARPTISRFSRKHITCRFWYRGTCRSSEEECPYAHTWTGQMFPKKPATCTYWENNRQCKFSDEECEYVHGYDFQRNVDVARREGPDNVNGFLARHRSDSPDRYGLRQDEAEVRRDRTSLAHLRYRPDERTPIQSPSLASTASFELRKGATRDVHMEDAELPVLTEESLPTAAIQKATNEKDTADPVNICLSIRPASSPTYTMDLKLVFDTKASRIKFLNTLAEGSSLGGSEICRSRDFEAYWFSKDKGIWASGGIVFTPADTVATYLEDFLALHSSCVAIRTNDFMFVVYATRNPDWKFMPHRGPEKPGLRWYLQAAVPGTADPIITKPTKSSFISMCAEHLDLNPEILFAGNKGKHIEKTVYLFFPRETPETKLVEVFLNEVGARFVHSDDCDLWSQFCSRGSAGTGNRVVLFHPSMTEFWKVPEFSNVLLTGVNMFQIGVSKSVKTRLDSPTKYHCTRLFPSGTLTLITDDIFKYHPAQALQVLGIYEGYKKKPEGGRNDRIYCRPGVLAWLAELIDEDREKGILAEDSPRIRCWQLVCELLGTPVADHSRNPFRSDMKPPSMLYSPPKSEMPTYGPMWDSSEEEATGFLVGWFAGHGIEECENYRRFDVLYEQHGMLSAQTPGLMQPDNPKDPKEWMKKFTHIRVTTPARYIVQVENWEKSKTKSR